MTKLANGYIKDRKLIEIDIEKLLRIALDRTITLKKRVE